MAASSSNPFVFVSYPRMDKNFIREVVHSAQTLYEQLPSEAHRLLARMLFLRLVDLNVIERGMIELQVRRVFMTELVLSDAEQSNLMHEVVNVFVDGNILINGELNEKWFVSVNHEILLQEWALLHNWIQEQGMEAIRLQRRMSAAAVDWQLRGHAKESLYRGKLLEEALGLLEKMALNEVEEELIKASMKEQGTQFSWEVVKMAAIGVGIVGTAVTTVIKMQTDTQLSKTKYWRNKNSRDLRRLKKTLQKKK
jgi:hypothetical protein